MDADSEIYNSERKFGRIFIKWKIQHYSLFKAKPGHTLISPIFNIIGSQVTNWQVIVTPCLKTDNGEIFLLKLNKLNIEDGDEMIWCERKLWLETEQGKELGKIQIGSYFNGENATFQFDDIVLNDARVIFDGLELCQSDTLHLYFQLLVSHKLVQNDFTATSDIGINSLSSDLLALYKSGTCSDAAIRVESKDIPVHKAVLLSRSPFFKYLFEEDRMKNVVVVKGFDHITVDAIFSYLYSGKLEFVLGPPSNSIGDCAELFQIEEVIQYYTFDYLLVESVTDVEEIFIMWKIEHFQTKLDSVIPTQVYSDAELKMTFQFYLYPKGQNGNTNFVSIFVLISTAEGSQKTVCIEICVSKSGNEIAFGNRVTGMVTGSDSVQINWPHELIFNPICLNNGTLEIYVKIRVNDVDAAWVTTAKPFMKPFRNPKESEHSYNHLSKDMSFLLETNSFTDVTFISDAMYFSVHKCILAARSKEFFNLVKEWNSDVSPGIQIDIKPGVLITLMRYFYTGILECKTETEFQDICHIAEKYFIPVLKTICSKILEEYTCVENVTYSLEKCTINN